jgi:hypothetical protein
MRPDEPLYWVLSHALHRLADDHMLTKPMADLLMQLDPRALDTVFGPDVAAEMDRELNLPEGTSGRVLRDIVRRFSGTASPIRRAADRSTCQFPVAALPDYPGWSGPAVPGARTISGSLVRAGLATPVDRTAEEYLTGVRNLWLPSVEEAWENAA